MTTTRHPWLTTGLIALLALGGAGGAATLASGTQERPTDPAFVVQLEESGDATVTLRMAFDLDTAENETFRTLEANTAARAEQFRERLASVANRTEAATGREMSVANARGETWIVGDTGVVALTVEWRGLAARTADGLRLDEPFASGFAPTRPFVVVAPDGGELTSVQPAPDATSDGQAVWNPGTDLSGFTVTVTGTTDDTATDATTAGETTDTRAPTPLAGVVLAVTAAAAAFGLRRRTR